MITATIRIRPRHRGQASGSTSKIRRSSSAQRNRAARSDPSTITWDDETSVEVWLTAKANGKSAAAVAHRKLASKEDAERRKAYWGERLEVLAKLLEQ